MNIFAIWQDTDSEWTGGRCCLLSAALLAAALGALAGWLFYWN